MILRPYVETLGVIVLAVFGVWIGRQAARTRPAYWLLTYLAALGLAVMIAVPRWIPQMEFVTPFCWIMADRREFAWLALVSTLMLATPMFKLPRRGQKVMVSLLMVVFVTVYSVLPFLLPAFNYSYLRGLKTNMDATGICMQNNGYNCGPAAAVTALRRLGVQAEEGEIAILAHTTSIAGTPADSLCAAINRRYQMEGIRCRYQFFDSVSEMRGKEPVIATVKFGFLVDHYVAVLAVSDTGVQFGDPVEGLQTVSQSQFAKRWREGGIVVQRISDRQGQPR